MMTTKCNKTDLKAMMIVKYSQTKARLDIKNKK